MVMLESQVENVDHVNNEHIDLVNIVNNAIVRFLGVKVHLSLACVRPSTILNKNFLNLINHSKLWPFTTNHD